MWLWRVWATACQSWLRASLGRQILKVQKQHNGGALVQDTQKLSQGDWGKTQDAMEAVMVMERTLNQALLELHGLGSTHADPHPCYFWRTASYMRK